MLRFGRIVAGVVVGTLLVGGTASASAPAKKKKVNTDKFAKVVCTNFADMDDVIETYINTYNNETSTDPVTFHGEVLDLTNQLLSDLEAIEKKLSKAYPDIDDGKNIAKSFVETVADRRAAIAEGLAEFEAADPTGVAFQADVSSFQISINLLDVGETDPFAGISDQDLLGSFDDEKSCEGVVDIF